MLGPDLLQRWTSQPPQGELYGLSAALADTLVGFAIAEQVLEIDTHVARLCCLVVLPDWHEQRVADRLLNELQRSLCLSLHSLTTYYSMFKFLILDLREPC